LITVEGKEVFTELGELVDPMHTAVLLIDMQRDFIASDGVFGELGIDLSMYRESLPRLVRLLEDARLRRRWSSTCRTRRCPIG
jgi:hypothetical protein